MDTPFKKESAPNFANPEVRLSFVQEAHDQLSLLHKELDVNRAQQALLSARIRLMNEFVNDLPSFDPQYSMVRSQVQMDQVERDELKRREEFIEQQLRK